ncbi:sensor histidine kinase [Chthoniobacter flavus]|uniref:sensor histidine kinase n=1 Tax=Chthoniobacter flavus TaxID=191863 RepID=UPI0014049819|nr:sensor histidine kinase [Chthoniobacter flavus]
MLSSAEPPPGASPANAEILVDGKPLGATAEGFRIPASHKSVSFRLGRSPEDETEGSRRVQFKLEGVDNGWRQLRSEMSLMVRFGDAAGDQVAQRIFVVEGISQGWRGSVESSAFTERRETVRVPPDSTFLTVAISSSGPPTAMGIYLVRGVKIFRNSPSGPELLFAAATDREGTDTNGWRRSGTRPSMAKMVHTSAGEAFCILDDDPNAHAEWNLPRAAAPKVQPGESLTVEWSEMYDIGTGSRFEVNYGRLNAGHYRFLTDELDTNGSPLAVERRLDFVVLEPLWKHPLFWISGSVVIAILLWLGGRAIIQKRIRQHLASAEQEHLIERERLRIARDLHDDLGARLTHISLVSGLAENEPQSATTRENFQQISGMARELVAALNQTVWTVNPEHDHLESLVDYVCQLTHNLCETARIRGRIHSCEVPDQRRVTSETRHNVTLAVKEALHNAIKHAGAAEITLRVEFNDPRLRITIADDGRGFDSAAVVAGNGLGNMRRRMALIGGVISFESSPGAGTQVHFEVPIPPTS